MYPDRDLSRGTYRPTLCVHAPCVGLNIPDPILSDMSVGETEKQELIRRFLDDEIGVDELQDQLNQLGPGVDRDELWARWAEQGLFDGPIEQDEWVSRRNGQYRVVQNDG